MVALRVAPWSQSMEIRNTYNKTHVFGGFGIALPPLATPNRGGVLDTLGACCRAVFLHFGGALVQLKHAEAIEAYFSGKQNTR